MPRKYLLLALALVLLAGGYFVYRWNEGSRRARYVEAVDHGARMEENQRFSEAVLAYEAALEDLVLRDEERSDLRYRLARSRIEGNDLSGALGVLGELAAEDVARFNIDLGELYRKLGDKARAAGLEPLAAIAYREGRAVSPARYEEFTRRLEESPAGPREGASR
ncbi:MAG: hypothetical protein HY812_03235 [Planctomycetes bacterium]|nr:hypothetical protein [Planctomycetota bacterium]